MYSSFEEAANKPNGLVGIAIFLKVRCCVSNVTQIKVMFNHNVPEQQANTSSPAVKILTSQLQHIKFRGIICCYGKTICNLVCLQGQKVSLKSLSLRELIQDEQSYITYEGSLTMPSCEEVVTWIVINKVWNFVKSSLCTTSC